MKPVILPRSAPDTRAGRISSLMRDLMQLDAGKAWVVEVKEETRSAQQHKWLFTCYGLIVKHCREHMGEDMSVLGLHEWLKVKYLAPTTEIIGGDTVQVWPSTTKLTKSQFSEYFEAIARWSAEEMDFVIPEPDFYHRTATEKRAA